MRLVFSLLVKLLYLLRLKGYLSPSQPLITNYFQVNLSLRDLPSGYIFNISQCVWACACSVFCFLRGWGGCLFVFSGKWNQFCHSIRWEPTAGCHLHLLNCLTPPPPPHFLLSPKGTVFLYTLQELPSAQKVPDTDEPFQSPMPTCASPSIARPLIIDPWSHIIV